MLCFRKMRLFSLLVIVLLAGLCARWWSWLGPGKAQVVWANDSLTVATTPEQESQEQEPQEPPSSTGVSLINDGSVEEDTDEPASCLNINLATQKQLEKLPGIGPVIAKAILEERVRRGLFTDLKQLLQVKGIGEKRLESILPHLCVIEAVKEPVVEPVDEPVVES
jgi:competence ComEA-like helix-hairpin-helix protein